MSYINLIFADFFNQQNWNLKNPPVFFPHLIWPPRNPPPHIQPIKREPIIPHAPSDRDSIFIWRSSPPLGRWQAQYLLAALFLGNPSGYGRLPTGKGRVPASGASGVNLAPRKWDFVFLLMEMIDGENFCEGFGVIAPTKTDWLVSL